MSLHLQPSPKEVVEIVAVLDTGDDFVVRGQDEDGEQGSRLMVNTCVPLDRASGRFRVRSRLSALLGLEIPRF